MADDKKTAAERRKEAEKRLYELVEHPGVLRVITNVPARLLAQRRLGPRHPGAWEQMTVIGMEGPNHKGIMTARCEDGSWCAGFPEDLLKRLMQAEKAERERFHDDPLAFAAQLVDDKKAAD